MISKQFIDHLGGIISHEGQKLIIDFFITFSRFECALKVSGFLKPNTSKAEPNWDAFLISIRASFDQTYSQELIEAADYLINQPPRVQMVDNGQLVWQERAIDPNEPQIHRLGKSIRDIRNNLFHGGKFHGKFVRDVSRNDLLLSHSIIILNDWLRLSNSVRESFLEPIE